MTIEELALRVEKAEPTAHCFIDKYNNQITVAFEKRPDVKISLLTPYAKAQIKKGQLDEDIFSEMLFSIKRIANFAV